MRGRIVLAAGLLAGLTWTARGPAAEPTPAMVEAFGSGRVRLRLAEGTNVPCDSSTNRPVLDGWIEAGTPLMLFVGSSCICVEHTWGTFRKSDWAPGQIVCNRARTRTHRADRTIRVRFSTDAP
jgi:hypothetical protein